MKTIQHDLVVLGGGPGGYVAAIRAAQLGLNAACVDENSLLGGTCLRVGCIPSKALLESTAKLMDVRGGFAEHGIRVAGAELDPAVMMRRKEQIVGTLAQGVETLFKRHKIARYAGRGRLDGRGRILVEGEDERILLEARHIVIATGSKPARLHNVECDGSRIGTSTEALSYPEVPKHLVVIGGGYIGLELGSVWSRAGAKVTVLEALDRILPGADEEIARQVQPILEKQGLQFRLGCRIRKASVKGKECVVELEGAEAIRCDRVLVAVGRVAATADLGLDSVAVQPEPRGEIPVDDGFETSAPGVFALGDCIRGPKLAHKASEEGMACVERIVTGYGHVDYDSIPAVVYTHPEIASVGATEEQLQKLGCEYRKGFFPFRANGRARTLGEVEGGVKLLADARTDRVLGVHILGSRAGDMIAEAAAAMAFGASSEDIARVCHAHPTLSEALGEAARAVLGQAIHA
ncbi:MAG: dihydrolipoyl dehydrogenase [Thermoguttaceae bacterium]